MLPAVLALGQSPAGTQPYGKIDQADLEMKACDFEKDANAEILFDKGDVYFGDDLNSITMDVHKRIKIFNEHGNKQAEIHLRYRDFDHVEYITGLQAETINLSDGKQVISKLDKKQVFVRRLDKYWSEMAFTLPDVKAGSVIEYKYRWNTTLFYNMPSWFFQNEIPTRYSEFSTAIPDFFYFRPQPHLFRQMAIDRTSADGKSYQDISLDAQSNSHITNIPYTVNKEVRAMAQVPSIPDEPFMSAFIDNAESLRFQLVTIKPIAGILRTGNDTWAKVAGSLINDEDFGQQLNRSLSKERELIDKAKSLKTTDERIGYLFSAVRDAMKWNGQDDWYTLDGTSKAWDNKTGNSAEINLILYHLLKKSGIDAYPMVVSTREHGKVLPYYTSLNQFNRAVVYIPVDSTKNYVLDATGKYNRYDRTPRELLNSTGLWIDKSSKTYDRVFIHSEQPSRQLVMINGDIKTGGKMEGTAEISSDSYYRSDAVERYNRDGEKKYIDYLRDDNNELSVSSISFENMQADSLPLLQKLNFSLNMTGADEKYIYLNPNLFSSLKTNPFTSERRMTDIDMGYLRNYSIYGNFKIPAGYQADALPKSVSMTTPDKGIVFKRIIASEDGQLTIRYVLAYNKPIYFKDDYPAFHEFFQKMFEMLNEPIVLKKS